jgi:hypothetical protein
MTAGIETLVLPLSGWVFQWRADQAWRELGPTQWHDEMGGTFVPGEEEWVRWTGTLHRTSRAQGWTGDPSWWLIYDERPAGISPQVRLHDGTEPPVVTLGGIWMCEWVSRPQPATVTIGEQGWVIHFERPHYLPES